MTPTETNRPKCASCVTHDKWEAGLPTTADEMTRWSLWGCCCTPEQEAEAVAWMNLVTR